ncbi:MAG: FAD-binding oxidoreductase [Cryomorphaceae bacterium]|nr:FAD-binding oxidoreductase [Cryomorphaceae bacterium]
MFAAPPSYWEKERSHTPADLIIVGSGMVGLWTAYHHLLRHPEAKVTLLDQRPTGQAGASTRNAGFACFGSPTELLDDLNHEKEADIIQRLAWRYEGLTTWMAHFDPGSLGWQSGKGYEVFQTAEHERYSTALEALPLLNQWAQQAGIPGEVYQKAEGPNAEIPYAISIQHEAQLHPGMAHATLAERVRQMGAVLHQGITIRPLVEWTKAEDGWRLPSNQGDFQATKIVLATNAWTHTLLPEVDVVPGRGQVLLTSAIPNLPFNGTYHADEGYLYFRNVGQRLLLGGGRNHFKQAETTLRSDTSDEVQTYLQNYLQNVLLPGISFNIEAAWAGTMAFSAHEVKMPILRQVEDHCFVAARMGGMGVALAPKVGQIMADLLDG